MAPSHEPQVFVVAVSGTSGSGKSTLVRALAEALSPAGGSEPSDRGAALAMFFDDYAGVSDLPENDLPGWLARGADIDEWRTDRLVADLTALVGGGSILSLDGASTIGPVDTIVLEEPFGRARSAVRPLIDLALHIDLPLHVALARRLRRDFVADEGEIDAEQAARLRGYLDMYLDVGGRIYEEAARRAAEVADVVLDGELGSADLLAVALAQVRARRR